MPACALSTFLAVLAVNWTPAAIALCVGGVCWASTLALVGALWSGAVTLLAVSGVLLLDRTTIGVVAPGLVAGFVAGLMEFAAVYLFYTRFVSSDAHPRFWIVALHDRLHGVSI